MLDPTIRKPGSEIWIEFNTQYEDDFVFQRFVVNPPDNAIVEKVNYYDNPWTSKVILDQVERDQREKDPDFANKWLGEPCRVGGRIYPQFNPALDPVGNVRDFPWELVRTKGNCIMSIDPHAHYYPFCIWLTILPKNDRHRWPDDYYKWVYAEWPTFELLGGYYSDFRKEKQYHGDLSELAKEILRCDGKSDHGLTMFERGIDPRFAAGSGSWSWSSSTEGIVNLFRKPENGGLDFVLPQCKILDCQKDVIRSDLTWQSMSERSAWNEPSLYVAPWCKNMIQMMSSHRTEEGTEKEDERYKEGSDCLKIAYALLDGWKYKDPITRKPPQREGEIVHSNIMAGSGLYGSDTWMA
jgi:hypothetical protein